MNSKKKIILVRLAATFLPLLFWWIAVKYLLILLSNKYLELALAFGLLAAAFYGIYKGIVFVERKFEEPTSK